MIKEINEGSSAIIEIVFTDEDDAPITPSAIYYRVDDKDARVNIIPVTAVDTPTSTVSIVLPVTATRILTSTHVFEFRTLTVNVVYGDELHHTDEYTIKVKNLYGVPLPVSSPSSSVSPSVSPSTSVSPSSSASAST